MSNTTELITVLINKTQALVVVNSAAMIHVLFIRRKDQPSFTKLQQRYQDPRDAAKMFDALQS